MKYEKNISFYSYKYCQIKKENPILCPVESMRRPLWAGYNVQLRGGRKY